MQSAVRQPQGFLQRQSNFLRNGGSRLELVTCSLDGVFAVPSQLPVGPADMAAPCQKSSSGLLLDNTSAVLSRMGLALRRKFLACQRTDREVGTSSAGEVFVVPRRRLGGTQVVFLEGREIPGIPGYVTKGPGFVGTSL
eukprot:5116028-Amphidinium_carterae.4